RYESLRVHTAGVVATVAERGDLESPESGLGPGFDVAMPSQPKRPRVEELADLRPGHPRLHFDGAGLEALRARAAGSHQRYAALLVVWLERHRNWSPPTGLPAGAWNEVLLEECGAFVTNAALAAVVTGERADLAIARRWALAMSEVGPLPNYGLGTYAAGLARTYDWLYDFWSDSERERLRQHLAGLV